MTVRKYSLQMVFCLMVAVNVFAQVKQITEKEYAEATRAAYPKSENKSRRIINQTEVYRNGALSRTEEYIYEYILPDKYRYIYTLQSDGPISKVEIIKIGSAYYCRKNDGEWTQSKALCSRGGGGGFGGPSKFISSSFTVEVVMIGGKKTKLYRSYSTYKETYYANKEKEGLSYWENKFWLNKDGFVIRKETKIGSLEPEQIKSRYITAYEYDPDLKIEAPIKQPL